MEPLTLQTIASYACGIIRQGDPATVVSNVVTDTRQVVSGDLFLALIGDRYDGHHFLEEAAARGAIGAIIARHPQMSGTPGDFALIEVDDTLLGYQRLASAYRKSLSLKVVAITGSNGKTSTKDFTAAVLSQRYQVVSTEGNLNNHIGVPRMLLRAKKKDEIAVLELGMNHAGEIKPLALMVKPDVAIITNIGTAHLEFLGTREAIAHEKGMLLEEIRPAGQVILPAEEPFTPELAKRSAARVFTVGLQKGDLRAENIRLSLVGSEFDVVHDGKRMKAKIGVSGEHMIVNALFAIAAGLAFDLPIDVSTRALSTVMLTKGRLETKKVRGLQLIDDSYNANPESMAAALHTLGSLPCSGRRIAVLGRMSELGIHSEAGHRRAGKAAAENGISCIITVGDEAAVIAQQAETDGVSETYTATDTDAAAFLLTEIAGPQDLILIKGSRSAGMERVAATLATIPAGAQTAGSISTG